MRPAGGLYGSGLPVFFGKADATMVDQGSFAVTKEMNLQVGSSLRALSASPRLAEGLICICGKTLEFREELLPGMRELHLDVQGKQILPVFRFSRLVPVERLALEQARELWRKHTIRSGLPEPAPWGSLSRPETRANPLEYGFQTRRRLSCAQQSRSPYRRLQAERRFWASQTGGCDRGGLRQDWP